MRYRVLGKTGFRVSEVSFGSWGIGGPLRVGGIPIGWAGGEANAARQAVARAIDVGINFFDTADFYGLGKSEEVLGAVLRNHWNNALIVTKVGHILGPGDSIKMDFSRKHIFEACDRSLWRLQKEVIDLYQLHNPGLKDLERGHCIQAMEDLKRQGKIRAWGISVNTHDPEREGL